MKKYSKIALYGLALLGVVGTVGSSMVEVNSHLTRQRQEEIDSNFISKNYYASFPTKKFENTNNLELLTQEEYNYLSSEYIGSIIEANFINSWINSKYSSTFSSTEKEISFVKKIIYFDLINWISKNQKWNLINRMQWGKFVNPILPSNFDIKQSIFSNKYLNMNNLYYENMQPWNNGWISFTDLQVFNNYLKKIQIILDIKIQAMPFWHNGIESIPYNVYLYLPFNNFGISKNNLLIPLNPTKTTNFKNVYLSSNFPFENLNEYIYFLEKELVDLKNKFNSYETKNVYFNEEVIKEKNEISNYENYLVSLKEKEENFKNLKSENLEKIADIKKEESFYENKISSSKANLSSLKEEIINEKNDISSLNNQYLKYEDILNNLENINSSETKRLSNSKNKLENDENKLSYLSNQIENKNEKINKLSNENQNLQNQIEYLNSQISRLRSISGNLPAWKIAIIFIVILGIIGIISGLIALKFFKNKNKHS